MIAKGNVTQYIIMLGMTHTMPLGRSKNKINQILGISFALKKLSLFAVIAEKSVRIAFKEKIDNIKEFRRNYVMP